MNAGASSTAAKLFPKESKMADKENVTLPRIIDARLYGPQWVGKPMNLLRLTTIKTNLGLKP